MVMITITIKSFEWKTNFDDHSVGGAWKTGQDKQNWRKSQQMKWAKRRMILKWVIGALVESLEKHRIVKARMLQFEMFVKIIVKAR